MADKSGPMGDGLADDAAEAAKKAADAAKGALGGAAGKLSGAAGGAAGKLSGAASGTAGKVTGAASGIAGSAGALGSKGVGAAGSVGSLGKGAASSVGSGLGGNLKGGRAAFVPPNSAGKWPWKWPKFVLPLLLLLLLACFLFGLWGWGAMENRLNERAIANLGCAGLDVDTSPENIDWSYRSVTIDELPAGVSADEVDRVLRDGVPDCENGGDGNIHNITLTSAVAAAAVAAAPEPAATPVPPTPTAEPDPTATPEPDPTATPEPEPAPAPVVAALAAAAFYDGETITLTGEVPTEAQRAALVAAAVGEVGEANVIDELTIADGDPSETADTRVDELVQTIGLFNGARVIEGQASVNDDALSYTLLSPSDEARDAISLPGDGTIAVEMAVQPAFTG